MTDFLLYVLAGAGVGFAIGVTGVGGGSLMTPLLLLFGFPLHVAIGTDLLYAAITKAGGAVAHARRSNVDWRLVRLLAAGSIPASLITAVALNTLFGDPEAYAGLLTTALGAMLIVTALSIVLRGRFAAGADAAQPHALRAWIDAHADAATLVMGVLLGVCVTLSSVGAGAFGAAVLMLLYPALRTVRIIGTDVAHAVPLTLIAGLGHLALGNVDFALLGALIVGSLPAIWVGSRLGGVLPDGIMRPVLAAILMGLGVKFAML
ncbi:MAG TPA: sulfite exporter TauE/SafE family protein [Pseudomonadales bacterium]|nr:sulfite exporter TauE/SafE family protein [Pseudomonadales bacterium]